MQELRVPKRRTAVEVLLPGGAVRHVAVFLAEFAPGHQGTERLSDLLNGSADFVPALDVDSDAMTFLNRHAVSVARVAREVETEAGDDVTIPTEQEVEITLMDGASLTGLIAYVLPPDRSRLVDYLNDASPFFR